LFWKQCGQAVILLNLPQEARSKFWQPLRRYAKISTCDDFTVKGRFCLVQWQYLSAILIASDSACMCDPVQDFKPSLRLYGAFVSEIHHRTSLARCANTPGLMPEYELVVLGSRRQTLKLWAWFSNNRQTHHVGLGRSRKTFPRVSFVFRAHFLFVMSLIGDCNVKYDVRIFVYDGRFLPSALLSATNH
jgi:hypothetical protein